MLRDFVADRNTGEYLLQLLDQQVDISHLKTSEKDDLYEYYSSRLQIIEKQLSDKCDGAVPAA